MIIEKIYVEKVSSEELAEIKTDNIGKLIDILENDNPDSSYFLDVNILALLDYLYEGGYDDNSIITLNNNVYGDFLRFYYLKDFNIYIMELGVC